MSIEEMNATWKFYFEDCRGATYLLIVLFMFGVVTSIFGYQAGAYHNGSPLNQRNIESSDTSQITSSPKSTTK